MYHYHDRAEPGGRVLQHEVLEEVGQPDAHTIAGINAHGLTTAHTQIHTLGLPQRCTRRCSLTNHFAREHASNSMLLRGAEKSSKTTKATRTSGVCTSASLRQMHLASSIAPDSGLIFPD